MSRLLNLRPHLTDIMTLLYCTSPPPPLHQTSRSHIKPFVHKHRSKDIHPFMWTQENRQDFTNELIVLKLKLNLCRKLKTIKKKHNYNPEPRQLSIKYLTTHRKISTIQIVCWTIQIQQYKYLLFFPKEKNLTDRISFKCFIAVRLGRLSLKLHTHFSYKHSLKTGASVSTQVDVWRSGRPLLSLAGLQLSVWRPLLSPSSSPVSSSLASSCWPASCSFTTSTSPSWRSQTWSMWLPYTCKHSLLLSLSGFFF